MDTSLISDKNRYYKLKKKAFINFGNVTDELAYLINMNVMYIVSYIEGTRYYIVGIDEEYMKKELQRLIDKYSKSGNELVKKYIESNIGDILLGFKEKVKTKRDVWLGSRVKKDYNLYRNYWTISNKTTIYLEELSQEYINKCKDYMGSVDVRKEFKYESFRGRSIKEKFNLFENIYMFYTIGDKYTFFDIEWNIKHSKTRIEKLVKDLYKDKDIIKEIRIKKIKNDISILDIEYSTEYYIYKEGRVKGIKGKYKLPGELCNSSLYGLVNSLRKKEGSESEKKLIKVEIENLDGEYVIKKDLYDNVEILSKEIRLKSYEEELDVDCFTISLNGIKNKYKIDESYKINYNTKNICIIKNEGIVQYTYKNSYIYNICVKNLNLKKALNKKEFSVYKNKYGKAILYIGKYKYYDSEELKIKSHEKFKVDKRISDIKNLDVVETEMHLKISEYDIISSIHDYFKIKIMNLLSLYGEKIYINKMDLGKDELYEFNLDEDSLREKNKIEEFLKRFNEEEMRLEIIKVFSEIKEKIKLCDIKLFNSLESVEDSKIKLYINLMTLSKDELNMDVKKILLSLLEEIKLNKLISKI